MTGLDFANTREEEEEEDLFIFNGTNAIYSRPRGMVCMLSMFCTAHSHSPTTL
jgi:hypothetical protein